MIKLFNNFRKDEAGAVTVDWVVLTAGIIGLAIAAFGALNGSVEGMLDKSDTALTGVTINTDAYTPNS